DRVLHLRELHLPLAREDAIAAVDLARARENSRDAPVEARNLRWKPAAESGDEAHNVVLEERLLPPFLDAAPRARRTVLALRLAQQRHATVGPCVELEVVVGVGELVEPRERLVEWHRMVESVQRERGDAAQRDGRYHPERA